MRTTLEKLFARASPNEVYTLPQIAQQIRVAPRDRLISALAELTRDRVVDQVFRVESPKNRGGIQDFYSFDDIPDEINDWRQGELLIPVTPRMVRVLFRKHLRRQAEAGNVQSAR